LKILNLNKAQVEWKYKSPDCNGGILTDGIFVYDMKCDECKRQKYLNKKDKWIEIVKQFIGFKVIFFRICDRCNNTKEIDEGRIYYDKWICADCSGRMGF